MAQASSKSIDALTLLSDDLLAEIFLRLPTLADVGRAATACTAFRRVVADRGFLLRLRSTHPAPLLGLLSPSSFHPAEPPHASAPCARALARAADSSFSFVDVPSFQGGVVPVDARDGRVLLQNGLKGGDLVVCDPLSRRYQLLPKIPREDYGSSSASPRHSLAAFLVPSSPEDAGTTTTSFRVVCMDCRPPEQQLVAFVFSSTTGQWIRSAMDPSVPTFCRTMSQPCYAYGCFYWRLISPDDENRMLVLDTGSMELSTVDVLSGSAGAGQGNHGDFVIVEAGEGRIGMYSIHHSVAERFDSPYCLSYAVREIGDDGKSKWQPEKSVVLTLPYWNRYSFVAGASDQCLLQQRVPRLRPWRDNVEAASTFLSVEFEATTEIKRVCAFICDRYAKPYTGFPPSLCLPSV